MRILCRTMDTRCIPTEGYLSKKNAAAYADVSQRTLDCAVERGELEAFRLILSGSKSRKLLFCKADIDRWIERHRVGAALDKKVVPLMRLDVVLRHPRILLRLGIALGGSQPEPLHGFLVVLRHALAFVVHYPEVVLGLGMALGGC